MLIHHRSQNELRGKLARGTVDALLPAIGEAIGSVTADDALNFTRHCGYAATTK
jgi:hypothetical protein